MDNMTADVENHGPELFCRKIIDRAEKLSIGRHKSDGWPAVKVVTGVDIGPLAILDPQWNKVGVQQGDVFSFRERFLVHPLAVSAPKCRKKKHHRLVLFASRAKSLRAPFLPR